MQQDEVRLLNSCLGNLYNIPKIGFRKVDIKMIASVRFLLVHDFFSTDPQLGTFFPGCLHDPFQIMFNVFNTCMKIFNGNITLKWVSM